MNQLSELERQFREVGKSHADLRAVITFQDNEVIAAPLIGKPGDDGMIQGGDEETSHAVYRMQLLCRQAGELLEVESDSVEAC